ncbi:MAG: phytanoyl-CoA dioxygenase family protein, partial [Armatimonadetes bacterium]|nr:phytanoyl-CoA dioxygenase family protein [Armatimonadota bacterium]
GILTEEDLAPLIDAYSEWIDERARTLHAEGKITELHADAPFDRRFALLFAQSPEISKGMDLMETRLPAAFRFMENEHLLDAVESIIGPEITCSPIQHIRAKPPAALSGAGPGFYNVPWHQDAGVTWEEAENSDIITCWIPLVDATVETGCMEVMPGAWKGSYLEHQAEGGTTIRPDLLPDIPARPVPVLRGGVIFMHRHTPHSSTPNLSDRVRWSIDLRYQPTGTPTGRPFHPEFVARSRENPESVLTDPEEWSRRWVEALNAASGVKAHRVK